MEPTALVVVFLSTTAATKALLLELGTALSGRAVLNMASGNPDEGT